MSVLIKGMEMPTSCQSCRFAGFGGRRCELNVCIFTGESQPTLSPDRMSNCPLVPVPPHGRLIDADYLYNAVEQRYRMSSGIEHRCERDLLDVICGAPTIIPAEEEIADLCTKGHLHLGYAEEGET